MKPTKKQVWNNIDAFGLLNGISIWDENYLNLKYVRIPDESNIELKHKINKFAEDENPLRGNLEQELIIGLANELGLESYDNMETKTFDLTRVPIPFGDKREQDIWLYYLPPNTTDWLEVKPQYWSEDVENNSPTSGFMVWENEHYNLSTINYKTNKYSRLLQIYSILPNNSRIKVVYYQQKFDENDNKIYIKYTDTSNIKNINDDRFYYKSKYEINYSDLLTKPIVYTLSEIPKNFNEKYYNNDKTATGLMYELRDKIDTVYRHRWKNLSDRKTIWDINLNFSKGTIPSFYDCPFEVISGFYIETLNSLTGGLNYYNPTLYIKDIDIITDKLNDKEYWYPVLQPGPLYIKGQQYFLMENASGVYINLSSGSGILPSGIEIYHKVILNLEDTSPSYNYFYKDMDYELLFRSSGNIVYTHDLNPNIARKRSYLISDMGFELPLKSGEYAIDYKNRMIYSSGILSGILYWDNVIVQDKVTIQSPIMDLNPLNDTMLGYDEYFLIVGE